MAEWIWQDAPKGIRRPRDFRRDASAVHRIIEAKNALRPAMYRKIEPVKMNPIGELCKTEGGKFFAPVPLKKRRVHAAAAEGVCRLKPAFRVLQKSLSRFVATLSWLKTNESVTLPRINYF